MGLFDKKFCDICGNKIGLLGNRKLEDGNLCKDCASKLSPWFSDRRRSTVADIKAQLADREANQAKVAAFNATRTLGENYIVYLDEDAKKFIVSTSSNFRNGNPDVLDFSQVTGCDLEIDEDRTEIYHQDAEGHNVSYNPPRYDYSYNFNVHLRVNHPWFDEMTFRLNRSAVRIPYGSQMPAGRPMSPGVRPPMQAGRPASRPIQVNFSFGGGSQGFDPSTNVDYQRYVAMGNELKEVLMQIRQEVRDNIAAANAPKMAVTCPYCGASTIPDLSGCCEYCGGAVNG